MKTSDVLVMTRDYVGDAMDTFHRYAEGDLYDRGDTVWTTLDQALFGAGLDESIVAAAIRFRHADKAWNQEGLQDVDRETVYAELELSWHDLFRIIDAAATAPR